MQIGPLRAPHASLDHTGVGEERPVTMSRKRARGVDTTAGNANPNSDQEKKRYSSNFSCTPLGASSLYHLISFSLLWPQRRHGEKKKIKRQRQSGREPGILCSCTLRPRGDPQPSQQDGSPAWALAFMAAPMTWPWQPATERPSNHEVDPGQQPGSPTEDSSM